MREVWRTKKVDKVASVQRVYNRVVAFDLPRPFVMVTHVEQPGFYIAEFVPDGQNVTDWTQMITVTGKLGAGAVAIDDVRLAALFEPKGCSGKIFRDLGATTPLAGVTGRFVLIGCGAGAADGSERGVLAVFRDTKNSWTVQYAERNHGKPPFAEATALDHIKALAPAVIPVAEQPR